MTRSHLFRIAAIALFASPVALAEEPVWYPTEAGVSTADVDAYFAMDTHSDEFPVALKGLTAHDRISFEDLEAPHNSGAIDHSQHTHFNGYCPTTLAEAELKLGTAQQFIEIGEFSSLTPTYDQTTPHAIVDGGNVFAKAEVDWREVF